MERTYGSLNRQELGSSYSALDGVPFKIGRDFCKPEQITPPQLSTSRATDILSQEYSFETEEAVLAWARACDEAIKKVTEEQAQISKLAEEKQSSSKQVEPEENIANGAQSSCSDGTEEISVYDVPKPPVPAQKDAAGRIKPVPPPKGPGLSAKAMSEPGAVLTPTPIKRTRIPSASKEKAGPSEESTGPDSQLDLAMFEAEADPFDNLELQTLNDMEELKFLLNSDSVKANSVNSAVQEGVTEANESCIISICSSCDVSEAASPKQTNQVEPVEGNTSTDNGGFYNQDQQDAVSLSDALAASCDDGEYVEIARSYKPQPAVSQSTPNFGEGGEPSGSVNGVSFHKSNLSVSGLPSVNSKIYKPVLPPIGKPVQAADSRFPQPTPAPRSLPNRPSNQPFSDSAAQAWGSPSQSCREPGKALPVNQHVGRGLVSQSPPLVSSIKPCRPAPPPPVAAKPIVRNMSPVPNSANGMSMSSGPSLAMFLGDAAPPETSTTQNPYTRHCISTSDLNMESTTQADSPRRNSANISPQPWNRHVPLPPPPSSSSYKPSCLSANQPVGLSDPYFSLSREEQSFTDSLTNMGFLRARVARAVQKFGLNEKEVLDHLLAVDKLGEQRYAPVLIESALFTFKNDLEKAEKFLKLHAQFEELGFQKDKIHDALVSTDLQHDKALDILTA